MARKEKTGDSQLIIDLSYLLDEFIAKLFNIEREVGHLKKKHGDFAIVYKCKRLFVQRYALRKYTDVAIDITSKLSRFFTLPITDKKFAKKVMYWFENKEKYEDEVELAAQYAAWRVKNKGSILFSVYKKIDHENLVSFSKKEVRPLLKPIYSKKFLEEEQESAAEYLDAFEEHSSASATKLSSEIDDKKTKGSEQFFAEIKEQLTAQVIQVQYLTDTVIEIVIKAPLAAKNFQPGQFFRLQNFETNSKRNNNTQLAMEGIAVTGSEEALLICVNS
ncbi:Riboflavin synthase-like beta-barrel [Cinara cedri]|uniref:Riboflavin synthase-like beta-barrel n=1 Tax=Cinara cedri TaxID=506608 RepID=A0A5E4NDH2_9HEMI|nr:Riboflavin synthase-like beta-barrel [Cinara cedri]